MSRTKLVILLVVAAIVVFGLQAYALKQIVSAAADAQISIGGNQAPTVKSFEKTEISANGFELYLLYISVSMQADKVCPVWVKPGTEPPVPHGCA